MLQVGLRHRHLIATWVAVWLVMSVVIGWAFVRVADANRLHKVEHLIALSYSADGRVCGTEVVTGRSSLPDPTYEYLVRWHSADPPEGMPANFEGRFCGSVFREETAVRVPQSDGTFLVRWPGETSRVEAAVFGAIVGAFFTMLAALFLHRRRQIPSFSMSGDDGAVV